MGGRRQVGTLHYVTSAQAAPPVIDGQVGIRWPRLRNRELSWLDFNERVLALADDGSVPLLERANFLAIFSTNLDEFFQVRVAGLKDQLAAGVTATSPDGLTATEQLREIRSRLGELVPRQGDIFLKTVAPALAEAGIRFSSWAELGEDDEKFLVETFEQRIFPVLTPLAVDPGHPFPYISDLSLNLAVIVRDPVAGHQRFARVKVPSLLPRFVMLPDGERYVPLEQVIAAHLDELFPGMEIDQHHAFRVTRNADLRLEEEEADDLLAAVELELRRRRFGRAVRLEIDASMTPEMRDLLQRELDLASDDVYIHQAPLGLGGLRSLLGLDRPDLKYPRYRPVSPSWVLPDEARADETAEPASAGNGEAGRPREGDMFALLRQRDILVHHPYESFGATVQEFVRQASLDPNVLAIKMTLYRTSGDSEIMKSLIRAAEAGKQVAVLVELKARFDESANIEWARALETVGVHVGYGLIGLKVHAKTLLVVRDEPDGLRCYGHVGTGNYNWLTAAVYEDLGLLTSAPAVGGDLTQLFNQLTGYGRDVGYDALLVAPHTLRQGLVKLIRHEAEVAAAGGTGRIEIKLNSLVDPGMIDELYAASQAGVSIDLVVRGICCLVPGVPGQSENIRVRSIVGRYLEHSRIYYFGNGEGPGKPRYLIGSADLMERNLDRRVEVLVTVASPDLQDRLRGALDIVLADELLAWELNPDGTWNRVRETRATDLADPADREDLNAHELLQQLALTRARSS